MSDDSVLQEVRSAREAFARSHGYEIRAMVADLRARDDLGDWPVVRLAPRRPAVADATRSELEPASRESQPDAPAQV
jgi:hypothetical protein